MRKLAVLAIAIGLSLTATACFRVKQNFYLLPDGSGKVEMEMGMSPMLLSMSEGGEENPADAFSKIEGVVWEPAQESTDDMGWKVTKVVGYFKDINQVSGEQFVGIKFAKVEGGFELQLKGNDEEDNPDAPQEAPQEMDEQTKAMIKGMMAGLEVAIEFTMPGDVNFVTEGVPFFNKKDGKAGFHMTLDEMIEKDMLGKEPEMPKEVVIRSGEPKAGSLDALTEEVKKGLNKPR